MNDSLYQDVPALTTVRSDTVIPAQEIWEVQKFCGNAAYAPDVEVRLVWDADGSPEILASTHGDAVFAMARQLTGDGVKVLAIELKNDSIGTRGIGGSWEAIEL